MLFIINPIIVAEIGCNHKGDMKVAEQLIISAAKCGQIIKVSKKR